MLVLLFDIALEYFSDRQMHAFLKDAEEGIVCKVGLWRYSRHPNYLGEISVWLGVFLVMLPYACNYWYYGIGFLAVAVMFLTISIPLMEHRQSSRRPAYAEYCRETSCLLLLPVHKEEAAKMGNL